MFRIGQETEPLEEKRRVVRLTEVHRADSWSPAQEQIIANIQQAESVPRAEAIRQVGRLER